MKAGLEVHQQLATGKLFCDCPSELTETVSTTIVRNLRATGGEMHLIDPAAAFQAARGLTYVYESGPSNCLVEADEEPPHPLNPEALEVALTVALLLHANPVDEIEVMRKIVVDGSNTAGFQRTALVAVDGWLELHGKRYSVPTICLEEDAARKVGEGDGQVRYRLDRLGVPLIEIATGPEIREGEELREVAEEIGSLLRATKRVRRGIGTIREDLNVSTEGGARVEIKGVQELRLLSRYAETEVGRQKALLAIRDRLKEQGATVPSDPVVDVTDEAGGVERGPVAAVVKQGGHVLGLRLPGFAGLLGTEATAGPDRLGRELADHARAAGLKGILHSDELPSAGLTRELVERLQRRVGAGAHDAFVLVAVASEAQGRFVLDRVRSRAAMALEGVPPETRDPLPDGRTRYSRPLPGRERMYPETDVPPIPVPRRRLAELERKLPELPAIARGRLAKTYSLNEEVVLLLQRGDAVDRFEALVAKKHAAPLVARLLTQELPAAEAEAGEAARPISDRLLGDLLAAIEHGECAKEGMGPVLGALLKGAKDVPAAIHAAGLSALSREELEKIVEKVLASNASLVKARGMAAQGPLMGDVMREVRGRRDGSEVAQVVKAALARATATPKEAA